MNHYFKPRTPEPRRNGLRVVIGSMICTLVLVTAGTGIWMGLDAIRRPPVNQLANGIPSEPATNQDATEELDPTP